MEGITGFNPRFPTLPTFEIGVIPIGALTATVDVREIPGIIDGGV